MKHTIIIAEAGVNHNGDFDLAKKLILEAKKAGADFVKFQTFKTELNISKSAKKADYQVSATGDGESQFNMIKKLEFDFQTFVTLKEYCEEVGIGFLSTPFDEESIDFLEDLQPFYKIPSGEIVNLLYLRKLASKGKPIMMSTGMANMREIAAAIDVLLEGNKIGRKDITILHCNTEYPTPIQDVNLNAMLSLKSGFNVEVGYSDHTEGIEVPIAAVAMGAIVIEKHFTLDRTLPGPDHQASLEPEQLAVMIRSIRNIELAKGDGVKQPSPSEYKNIEIARKSLHLRKCLKEGELITEAHLIPKRPGDGISPMQADLILGKKSRTELEEDHKLVWSDFS